MDINTDSYNELNSGPQLKDLVHLTSVLRFGLLANDTSGQQLKPQPLPSCSTASDTSSSELEQTKIESTLLLNKKLTEALLNVENFLINKLLNGENKSSEQFNRNPKQLNSNTPLFRTTQGNNPFFMDCKGYVPPDNKDTVQMKRDGMYLFPSMFVGFGWSVKDKRIFEKAVLEASKSIRINELNSKISKIQCDANMNSSKKKNEIKDLEEEIKSVKRNGTLAQLALPINEEYYWYNLMPSESRHTPEEYSRMWKLFAHPSLNKSNWTKEEHKKLICIAQEHNYQDWDAIANKLNTNRSGFQCLVYYRTNFNNSKNNRWTAEEEEYLRRIIHYHREDNYIPWGQVAACMDNRTKIQVYNKFKRLSELRKGRFLPEEDSVLLSCAKKFGLVFSKIKKVIPGRSADQLRARYQVLTKKISAVWTVSEDKKLLQLMAGQGENLNYAALCPFFPDKDRANIRTRYGTLIKWLFKNPNVDIAFAPRRAARRLCHGQAEHSIRKALTKLESRMQNEVKLRMSKSKSKRVTKDSSFEEIEEAVIAFLTTENIQEGERFQKEEEFFTTLNKNRIASVHGLNTINLQKVLMLLKAKLNLMLFVNSPYNNIFPELRNSKQNVSYSIKSYSRKKSVQVTTTLPDIWGCNTIKDSEYFLPPNLTTISGLKLLISLINSNDYTKENLFSLSRKNVVFQEQIHALIERFNIIFVWPLLLSNEDPTTYKLL